MPAVKPFLVVFLRGVNVGGNKTFRPALLAKTLGGVNIGAAGTFVVPGSGRAADLRTAILGLLEFEAEVIVCRGSDVVELVRAGESSQHPYGTDLKTMISVLAARPKLSPKLPVSVPSSGEWQVRVNGVAGPFVTSVWRRGKGRLIYPNEVVEKLFGVAATTRGWSTMVSIRKILEPGAAASKSEGKSQGRSKR